MIFVLYPPGCYGSYVAKCLYYYTELNSNNLKIFNFDSTGSSHDIRANAALTSKIKTTHEIKNCTGSTVSILPDQNRYLDYFNNQFFKQSRSDLMSYILDIFPDQRILFNLKKWGLNNTTISEVPQWILREFFSHWLTDCMSSGYQIDNFFDSKHISINTNDIFDDFYSTYQHVVNQLGLTITTERGLIIQNHKIFLQKQQFHNSQIRCNNWVQDILSLDKLDSVSPCQSIFDESYVQYLLRRQGYEIECNNLNTFPSIAEEMKKLIYKQ